jgi:glycosyltransferase involved in cell wall biosynthesis
MAVKTPTSSKLPISGCVITYNEEKNIEACLESLQFCDEIVVVDSFSTDRTLEICQRYTSRIFHNPYRGNISQKNFALSKTKNEWVLSLDADERISPELREEIRRLFVAGFDGCSGYSFKRRAHYLGKWINHCGWYPDHKLRLFDKNGAHFAGIEPHDTVITRRKVGRLFGDLHHFTCASLSEHLQKIDKYSNMAAARLSSCSYARAAFLMVLAPLVKFVEMFVFKGGFLDGAHGFVVCGMSAFSRFLRYAKVVEQKQTSRQKRRPQGAPSQTEPTCRVG